MFADEDRTYYAATGPMTDLAAVTDLTHLPTVPAEVAKLVQGLLIHPFWAEAYGVQVPDNRQAELQIRSAAAMIDGLRRLDPAPLTTKRPAENRFLGNCRDFSTLTVALLRHAGVPARARCGFANYFEPGKWVDHWVVEHLVVEHGVVDTAASENSDTGRWVVLDAQVDDFQREITGLQSDPSDLPEGLFLAAGDAWLACQRGDEDGDTFGILDMWGQWFIAGNVGRDIASLNKIEMLPWDQWGTLAADGAPDEYVDEVAAVLASQDDAQIRQFYELHPGLHVPPTVTTMGPGGRVEQQAVAELQ